jgi:hypothetical protein
MVIGDCVKCLVCNREYRIRYHLGNKFPQSTMFHCEACGTDLVYGYNHIREKELKNIEIISRNFDLQVINLHPELPIDPKFKSDPKYFPNIHFMSAAMKKPLGHFKMRMAQTSMNRYVDGWDNIQQDFRYLKEQRWLMLDEKYGKDHTKAEKAILKKVFQVGRFYLEGKWWDGLYRDILAETELAKRHANFSDLKTFLTGYKDDFLHVKIYNTMRKYRDVEVELMPTLLNQKCDLEQKGLSSFPNWEKIEKIYGDLYEIYGDLLIIPTAINNLLQRNNYQTFATAGFTLAKYEDSDKAGRGTNFSANTNLSSLGEFYDSGIRNSTHHEASAFEIEDQNIVMRTGKGGKILKSLPLVDYLIHCNEIYARCLVLFNIMYKIVFF